MYTYINIIYIIYIYIYILHIHTTQSLLVPIFSAHSINLNLVSCINDSFSEYFSIKLSIKVFCYQYSISIFYSNHLQFHKNIWSESKEPRTKHVGKKGVQTWSFFKKDSVSFWTILCEPLLNNLIPTSLSHEWLLVLYLGLLPIHQLMSQQKQHFSLAFLLNISFFSKEKFL